MNVARSTFIRRGYILTALAVAMLLAVSSGTAWAQTSTTATSSFSGSSSGSSTKGTLQEGADADDLSKPRPLKVTIKRKTKSKNDPYNEAGPHLKLDFEYNGGAVPSTAPFTVRATKGSTSSAATELDSGVSLTFDGSGETRPEPTGEKDIDGNDILEDVEIAEEEIELTIEDVADPGDWIPEELVLTLSNALELNTDTFTVRDFDDDFTVTIEDDDPTPVLKFSKTDIQLAKGNEQTVTVEMGVGARGAGSLPSGIKTTLEVRNVAGEDDILLSVSPADAVGTLIKIYKGDTLIEPDAQGDYVVGQISDVADDTDTNDITLTIEAIDVSGFRDEEIELMLMDGRTEEQMADDGGGIDAASAMVTVLSGEERPTVTFSTDSVSIDEGDSETVHLFASGMQGDAVGMVSVAVRGDASISLEQNGSSISGGTVSFGGNANAALTIISNSDPSLEDGEEKTATVTITDANDASIGNPSTVTVTVVGSTAVPVLPLFGQLLLALLLMVGGARLYRRRQG